MKKIIDEYIAELSKNLNALAKNEQEEVCDFYREFLLDGDFTSRDQIVSDLGSPQELAAKIIEDYQKSDFGKASANVKKDVDDYQVETMDPFSGIKFDLKAADVLVTSGDQYQVKILRDKVKYFDYKVEDGQLVVSVKPSQTNNQHLFFFSRPFEIIHADSTKQIEITVPEGKLINVHGNTGAGDVNLDNLNLGHLKLVTKSGDLSLFKIKAETIDVEVASGDITVHYLDCQSARLRTASGDLSISDSRLNLNVSLASGDVNLSACELVGKNTVKAASGDLNFSEVNDLSYELLSILGDVSYKHSRLGYQFKLMTDSANSLSVFTSNGDIVVD